MNWQALVVFALVGGALAYLGWRIARRGRCRCGDCRFSVSSRRPGRNRRA